MIYLNRSQSVFGSVDQLKEMPVTASTMLVIIIGVLIFGALAGSLAWMQSRLRPAPASIIRPKRRPF